MHRASFPVLLPIECVVHVLDFGMVLGLTNESVPRWAMRKARANPLVQDPYVFRRNTYRVLLTRGREGLVLFVPPGNPAMDATAKRLEACGAMTVEGRRRSAVRVVA